MGISFGKQKQSLKVFSIRETQSMPAVRMKGAKRDAVKTRSTSYQTTLPGLPNLVSSSEGEGEEVVQPPPPFTLPPVSHISSFSRDIINPQVVAELSSPNSEDYSSCLEDFTAKEREKTLLISEILGKRIEELRTMQTNKSHLDTRQILSSRESRKILSSRDSYKKVYLRSRKRARRNSCLTESSLSNSNLWGSDHNTLLASGDTSMSETVIRDERVRRTSHGCKISRRSTLNSTVRYNSSSDEGLEDYSFRGYLNRYEKRSRKGWKGGQSVVKESTLSRTNRASTSAWQGVVRKTQASTKQAYDCHSYDASSELSSSDSEQSDQLNYSTRFRTNPFLGNTTNYRTRPEQRVPMLGKLQHPSKTAIKPELASILPDYARSSYIATRGRGIGSSTVKVGGIGSSARRGGKQRGSSVRDRVKESTSVRGGALDPSRDARGLERLGEKEQGAGPSHFTVKSLGPVRGKPHRRPQNDGFDDLDNAVEMFKSLL